MFTANMWRKALPFLPRLHSIGLVLGILALTFPLIAVTTKPRYYGHETVQDAHGVVAPWDRGLNGQSVRVAANLLHP